MNGVNCLSLPLLLFTCLAPSVCRSETCYSQNAGFNDCWNGCCGPQQEQECCASTVLILGLALGGGTVLLVVLIVVFCWACKDCRPKTCCGREDSAVRRGRGRLGRGRRSHHRSRRVVIVHPVAPPDYDTATQLRAPSVQPGFQRRNLPLSPPPPYTDIVPPPPSVTPTTTAPPPAASHSPELANPLQSTANGGAARQVTTVSAAVLRTSRTAEGDSTAAAVPTVGSSSTQRLSTNHTAAPGPDRTLKQNRSDLVLQVQSDGETIGSTRQNHADIHSVVVVRPAVTTGSSAVGSNNAGQARQAPPTRHGSAATNVPLPADQDFLGETPATAARVAGNAPATVRTGVPQTRVPLARSENASRGRTVEEHANLRGGSKLKTVRNTAEEVDPLHLI